MGLADYKITNILPNSVESSFLKFSQFLRSIEIVGLNLWNIILIITFLTIVVGIGWLIFNGVKYFKDKQKEIEKVLQFK